MKSFGTSFYKQKSNVYEYIPGQRHQEVRNRFSLSLRQHSVFGQSVHRVQRGIQQVGVVVRLAVKLRVTYEQRQYRVADVPVHRQRHVRLESVVLKHAKRSMSVRYRSRRVNGFMRPLITLSSIVAVRRSGKNASSSSVKNSSCVSMPYTRSKKSTTLCLCPGISPEGMSLFGRIWPAAGFWSTNLRLRTPCRSSRGTSERRMARARNDSFLP